MHNYNRNHSLFNNKLYLLLQGKLVREEKFVMDLVPFAERLRSLHGQYLEVYIHLFNENEDVISCILANVTVELINPVEDDD